jgi:hypothetical protein
MIPNCVQPEVTYDVITVEGNVAPVIKWCNDVFGPPGDRWFISNYQFYFRESKDALLFELRW